MFPSKESWRILKVICYIMINMHLKSFIIFWEKGTWGGGGVRGFVTPAIIFADVFRKVYAGIINMDVFHVL